MPAIPLSNVVVTPAVSAISYDVLWMSAFNVMGRDPSRPVRVTATVNAATYVSNISMISGISTIISHLVCGPICGQVNIPDFFSVATPTEMSLMGGLILAVQARAGC